MMNRIHKSAAAAVIAALVAIPAWAGITISQSSTQTIAGPNSLTFDEPGYIGGTPYDMMGDEVTTFGTEYSTLGVSDISGSAILENNFIDNFSGGLANNPDMGPDNELMGWGGVHVYFHHPVTDLNVFVQDPSGPGGFFGGLNVVAYKNGQQLGFSNVDAFFGGNAAADLGLESPWLSLTTDNGDWFDHIQFFGGSFAIQPTFIDDMTWTPEPTSLAMLGLAGTLVLRRRRRRAQ